MGTLLQDLQYAPAHAAQEYGLYFVAGLVLAIAWLASHIPARRATRVYPMVALRYE